MRHLRLRPISPPSGGTENMRGVYGPEVASSMPPPLAEPSAAPEPPLVPSPAEDVAMVAVHVCCQLAVPTGASTHTPFLSWQGLPFKEGALPAECERRTEAPRLRRC